MKIKLCILLTAIALSGCATTLSEENPSAYAESLAQAKVIFKSKTGAPRYEKYYNFPNHKAWAQSKVSSANSYVTNKTSKEFAIEIAIENCNQLLLKKYSKITDRVSCEIINVDNEWVSK
ncbi:hypothetical protein [Psychromonas algicola]|uniref:hypothetical protein n=1 Tax=Psychromonas algicola TaxID=2555642 RepID=UPI0010685FBF|nr:hypothetical protein [Psychromonas sp. RZ5]TEW52442.1 hypothetical protein E2R67_02055 [Psychromonas sp. RZ5]